MILRVFSPEEWKHLASEAHLAVFSEIRSCDFDRIDYALLAVDEADMPVMYQTVIEIDGDSVYWQHGGPFDFSAKNYLLAVNAYKDFIAYAKAKYKRITTRIENTHVSYLKFAMDAGFRVIGVRCLGGDIFCELILEFGG